MLLIVVFPTVWAKQIGDVGFMSLSMSCQIVAGINVLPQRCSFVSECDFA